MGFAQNLDSLMQSRGMTKYQLAKEIGCHQTSITNWLENGTTPQKRTLEAVAAVFGVTSIALCSDAPIVGEDKKENPTVSGEVLKDAKIEEALRLLSGMTDAEKQLAIERLESILSGR